MIACEPLINDSSDSENDEYTYGKVDRLHVTLDECDLPSSSDLLNNIKEIGIPNVSSVASTDVAESSRFQTESPSINSDGSQSCRISSENNDDLIDKTDTAIGVWPDIFAHCKLVISMTDTLPDLLPELVRVMFADDAFMSTFGYEDCASLGSFNRLMGDASSPATFILVRNFLRSGICGSCYMNLYRSNGVPLSCHLCVVPIRSYREEVSLPPKQDSSTANSSRSSTSTTVVDKSNELLTTWAVVTIRSASVVGNARLSGIG